MLIPATHFLDNGDGTAWWLIPYPSSINEPTLAQRRLLDRRCATCDGGHSRFAAVTGYCPDCDGTGRHTFEVAVACIDPKCPHCTTGGPMSRYRASIIPGMILPIRDNETDFEPLNHSGDIFICADGSAYIDTESDYMTDIILPSAAASGMFVVKVKIVSIGE